MPFENFDENLPGRKVGIFLKFFAENLPGRKRGKILISVFLERLALWHYGKIHINALERPYGGACYFSRINYWIGCKSRQKAISGLV